MRLSLERTADGDILGNDFKVFQGFRQSDILRKAIKHAGSSGYIASLPELLRARFVGFPSIHHDIWQKWYTALSEEIICKTRQGNDVLVIVHGGGLMTPERIDNRIQSAIENKEICAPILVGFPHDEMYDLLDGRLHDGRTIPVFSYKEFEKNGDLPRNYAIVMDLKDAQLTQDYPVIPVYGDNFPADPLFIARCGGVDIAQHFMSFYKNMFFSEGKPSQPSIRKPFGDFYGNWRFFSQSHLESSGASTDNPCGCYIQMDDARNKGFFNKGIRRGKRMSARFLAANAAPPELLESDIRDSCILN